MTAGHAAANVIFTEYVEGGGSNKAIEITNVGTSSIDLSKVSIALTTNGKAFADVTPITLTGTLAAGSSHVLTNGGAVDALKALSNATSNATSFNGDDALTLLLDGKIVDSFGQVGTDPGKNWGSGDTSTKDRTLRRKGSILVGDLISDDAFNPANEWVGFAKDTFDGLGCSGVAACGGDGNIPSKISGIAKTIINADSRYDFTPNVTNLDNDTLTFSIENKPKWADFDTSTGRLSGEVKAGDIGNYNNIVITVNDGTASDALASFSILVRPAGTNDVPKITGTPLSSIQATRSYSFTPNATDIENDTLVFAIENKPIWASFDTQSGKLTGAPNESQVGVYADIVISVADGHNTAQSLPAFSISVTDKPGSNYDYNQYYATAIGKSGPDLEAALALIARQGQKQMTYTQVWDALKYTDEDPANINNVILFYTGRSQAKNTNGGGTTDWNREHSWPKSHGFPEQNQFGYTDIHHLRPTNVKVNSARSNKDYDDGGAPVSNAPGNFTDDDSFEPRDAVKGDAARMMFYMAVRYDGTDGNMPDLTLVNTISGSKSATLGVLCNLMQWHRQDPIDTFERERHQRIVEQQGNRNPFVDNAEFAETLFAKTCPTLGKTAPVISGSPTLEIGAGSAYQFTPSASDANRDTLIFSVTNKPKWANFNSVTGTLTGTPGIADIAAYQNIQISVSDGALSANLAAFTINVVDPKTIKHPPTISGIPNTGVLINQVYRFLPTANDVDDDTLTFSIVNKPSWATFNTTTGELTGTPTKSDEGNYGGIVISVTDGNTAAVELGAFAILVSNDTPATNVIFTEYIEGSSNNKAIEITNFTGSTLDLSRVKIVLADNGKPLSTSGLRTQSLSGLLVDKASHVIVNSGANDEIKSRQNSTSTVTYFNGDDTLVLMVDDKITDVFGQLGTDPGSSWGTGDTSTKDRTLRRKVGIVAGDVNGSDAFDPSVQWQGFEKNVADGLGCSGVVACSGSGTSPIELGQCGDRATLISEIQGAKSTSPLVNKGVIVEGIVVASYQGAGQHGGFFLQEEDKQKDKSDATSEGIFVAHTATQVTPGQQIRFTAKVAEKYDLTQLVEVGNITTCATNALAMVTPTAVNLPFAENFDQESLEGMWVTLPQKLHVTLSHNFTRYGEVLLSKGLRIQPTNKFPKNDPKRQALADLNARNVLLVDDDSTQQNPESISYYPEFSADKPLRSGANVAGISGVIHYGFGKYKLLPNSVPKFENVNARRSKPFDRKSSEHIRVASFNVLNYFLDFKGRGASNEKEFKRQRSKIIRAITAMDADVVGLMEIENSGYGSNSAIQNLIDGLNERDKQHTWRFINPKLEKVGSDAVTVGLIYRSDRVLPVGIPEVVTDAPFDEQTKAHRPPMMQSFKPLNGGKEIKVIVNHFRSKGGSCGADMDDDVQGACNGQRVLASKTLLKRLGKEVKPSTPDVSIAMAQRLAIQTVDEPIYAILGDFNAYAYEDPMMAFYDAGFANLSVEKETGNNYSYYYGGIAGSLDHLLTANTTLNSVAQVMHWHINADEATALDYNTENKTDAQQTKWFGETPYRSSDHDPVIADFDLAAVVLPVNQAPTANDDKTSIKQGETANVNVLENDIDPDSDVLRVTSATLVSGSGSVSFSGPVVSFIPIDNFLGEAVINYIIGDSNGAISTATLTVTVLAKNAPPVANDDNASTLEDQHVILSVLDNDQDEAKALLQITGVNVLSGKGVATHSKTAITFTPENNFNGEVRLSYDVQDVEGASATGSVTINVAAVNDAPIAKDDIASTFEDQNLILAVLSNDIDEVKSSLKITGAKVLSGRGVVTYSEAMITFTPDNNFHGEVRLSYDVQDVEGASATGSVTINVVAVNDAPTANDDIATASARKETEIDVLANDVDVDGDALTITSVIADTGTVRIEGSKLIYQASALNTGSATIRYDISDGTESASANVKVTISTLNIAPIAHNDVATLNLGEQSISVSVLANDTDADGDTLTIAEVRTDVGTAVIENNHILFTKTDSFNGTAQVSYVVSDGFGGQDSAILEITLVQDLTPTIIVPAPMTVNAVGQFTEVDTGVATAVNSSGEAIGVQRLDSHFLRSGANQIKWQACDADNVCSEAVQHVNVRPLLSFASPSQVTLEGTKAVIPVLLSGTHFEYPVTVSYTLTGTANEDDFNTVATEVIITQGTQVDIEIDVLPDELVDTDETIVITLDAENANLGAQIAHTISISESNLSPVVTLSMVQATQSRTVMSQQDGIIRVQALVKDQNPDDTHTITWSLSGGLAGDTSVLNEVSIDPASVQPGTYQVDAVVTDNGGLSDTQSVYFKVVAAAPALDASKDSDGDMINDALEGFADDDRDGIPNYLDPIDAPCHVLPTNTSDWQAGLIEVEAGVCISLGSASLGSASAALTDEQIQNSPQISIDETMVNHGGIFDFVANIASGMQQVKIVLPLQSAIPANALYRKFLPEQEWVTFVSEGGNELHSAPGQQGYCPAVNDGNWQPGLVEGAWCVRLTLVDGGQYDADGVVNGKVVDPGGVGVVLNNNAAPVAIDDKAEVKVNQHTNIMVLSNDTDIDNDVLTVISASAKLGTVHINSDSSLQYQSAPDFIGNDTISYTVSDGQGAIASAQVLVTVIAKTLSQNHAPTAVNDSITVFNDEISTIDVLLNDTDVDGDRLVLRSATTGTGYVSIVANKLRYQPIAGGAGQVLISYTIADSHGAQSTGSVAVLVKSRPIELPETGQVKSTASSGSIPLLILILLFPALLRRRTK
ncbi:ExeM/NucH family extracellular endonuclease [Pseudoalteromonas sp. MMG005]|uniref:ExeM/NucH family extracellular endonuclease n=1 Tax=Pseudoalteromonas sp. MMG005 TaxID=2822682 RepID=UPI001B3A62EF|nr:ExeM/NucH family extracellular endonuclease [Pseudoalteromonas sp. MMG005]MBQ4845346.1 ExeM/NucH family extracellular endonuclease [Pseudoalteromonas sp. MMG005]